MFTRRGVLPAKCNFDLEKIDLPLLDLVRDALKLQEAQQAAYRLDMGSAWPETGLVFTTRTGRPIEPRNLVRSFRRICDSNDIRAIKVHHLRHTGRYSRI